MKKNILVVLTFLYFSLVVKSQTIITNDIPSSICAGSIISIPFTVIGSFSSNNIFTAQLSNASGSFTNPVNIGTLFSSTSGTINAIIPQSTISGSAYRIRVVGIFPSIIGTVNNVELTINPISFPSINITANRATQNICSGQSITFSSDVIILSESGSESGSFYYQWYKNNIETVRFNDTYTNSNWNDGDVIKCKIIFSSACHIEEPIWSNNIIIKVNNTNPDSWQQKSDVGSNQANGPSARCVAVGFSIRNKGYVGLGLETNTSSFNTDFWEYDTLSNSWTQKANFPGGGRIRSVGFSIGDKGYVGTGYKQNDISSGPPNYLFCNDFWQFDPMLNEWIQKSNFAGLGRADAVGFCIGSKGYIGTGVQNFGDSSSCLNDFWEYDPILDIWTQKNNVPGNPRNQAVGFSIGSKGYIGTGYNNRTYFNDFWEYNPSTDSWLSRSNFPGTPRYAAIGFSIGSKGYVGIGLNNALLSGQSPSNDFYEFNPVNNVWTVKANFVGGSRRNAVGFNIGSRGYVGLGMIEIYNISNNFFEYNPNLNSWNKKADFGAVQERTGAIGFSIGKKGFIGLGIVAGNMGGV
jgi:N-acetylneuraminic acid mutarotase